MKCKIADMDFLIKNIYPDIIRYCHYYLLSDTDGCDLSVSMAEKDINAEESDGNYPRQYLEFIALSRKIAEIMPSHNGFLFHSATFDVDGTGVAFAAHSGTGKTTHMLLWQKLLGDRLKIVNGDKPIVRYFDDEPNTPYAYGTPWNGKERLGCNMRTPLKHICFIERAEQNSCEKMDKNDAVNLIFNQVYMPKDPAAAANTIVLINRLISDCSLWKIKCNMDISAAETAYRTIFGE